jgi:hypothetical protein
LFWTDCRQSGYGNPGLDASTNAFAREF